MNENQINKSFFSSLYNYLKGVVNPNKSNQKKIVRRYDNPNLPNSEKYRLPPNMKSCDLSPNPNLLPSEKLLQFNLLKQIESFGTMASQLDQLDRINEYKEMWSSAMTECFNQLWNEYFYGYGRELES